MNHSVSFKTGRPYLVRHGLDATEIYLQFFRGKSTRSPLNQVVDPFSHLEKLGGGLITIHSVETPKEFIKGVID